MGKIRGTHSSPGVYTKITDIPYSTQHDGITKLGLVGETLKGPAFEPIEVHDWNEFVDYFGGKSTEKFKATQYPKYELPYIAESYLKASDQLQVCRVLGLSGYNAGPAWAIVAHKKGSEDKYLVAVIRSKGAYDRGSGDNCTNDNTTDTLKFFVKNVGIEKYVDVNPTSSCNTVDSGISGSSLEISSTNLGKFTLVVTLQDNDNTIKRYPVSLNAGSKDYIFNVLGSNPLEGDAEIFVEEFYDYYLEDLINKGDVNEISGDTVYIEEEKIKEAHEPVLDILDPDMELTRKNLGQTYLCDKTITDTADTANTLTIGHIYKVVKETDKDGKVVYKYKYDGNLDRDTGDTGTTMTVFVLSKDSFAYLSGEVGSEKIEYSHDWNDYKEQFRCASTPWFVSEIKGVGMSGSTNDTGITSINLSKLFRFHTITDGNFANQQIKISVANIKPDDGTFDIYVRDFNDSDANPTILESFRGVNLVPGSPKYLGLQVGTLDGEYILKSKYIIAEIIEDEKNYTSVPAGFLGYPVRYNEKIISPSFKYNRYLSDDIKVRRQYFGLSDLTGIDVDILNYKGRNAYNNDDYANAYTAAFHLDCTLQVLNDVPVFVDGVPGFTWETVDVNNVTTDKKSPIIGSEAEMEGTIYEDIKARKFTACFYGGFDGWDIYRESRTNTDNFRENKYKGEITSTCNHPFSKVMDGEGLALEPKAITTDYYAYLAGVNQFENPERYEINLFATPGIDYVNNTLLVDDVIDMIENRADTLYIPTTPDKPAGASDAIDEMYSAQDAADNLEDSAIDTFYAATYYPWVKFFDKENSRYINLPATKDALRIMANVDNKKYPWVAPAGFERGSVECEKMHFYAKLEDRDEAYDGRINSLMSFSRDGVKIWGNKTMYTQDTPMNRINTVRLVLYLRKLLSKASLPSIFEPNDEYEADNLEKRLRTILNGVKEDRGIYDYKLQISQTDEEKDQHEIGVKVWVKPTPVTEYIEIEFIVTPMGVSFEEVQ